MLNYEVKYVVLLIFFVIVTDGWETVCDEDNKGLILIINFKI